VCAASKNVRNSVPRKRVVVVIVVVVVVVVSSVSCCRQLLHLQSIWRLFQTLSKAVHVLRARCRRTRRYDK